MTRLIKSLLTVAAAVLAAACASPELQDSVAAEFASKGLQPVRNSGFEQAFILPGANLPAFAAVHFEPMNVADVVVTQTAVSGTTRSNWQMTPEKEASLADLWRQATARAFADYPRQGDGSLRVISRLTRVSPANSATTAGTATGSAVRGVAHVVDISAEFRIYDADSMELLGVARDLRTIASAQWGRAAGVDLANLFNGWASLLHTRLSGR